MEYQDWLVILWFVTIIMLLVQVWWRLEIKWKEKKYGKRNS